MNQSANIPSFQQQSLMLESQGRLVDALDCNAKLLAQAPQAPVHAHSARLLFRLGRVDEAMAHFRKAIEIRPDFADAHHDLGLLHQSRGQWDDAAVCYQRALAMAPGHVLAWFNLGLVLRKQGRAEAAAQAWQQVLAVQPDHVDAHFQLASLMQAQDALPEAEQHFRAVIARKADHAEAHNDLGCVLQALGRPLEAKVCFEQALRLRPQWAEAQNNLACIGLVLGELALADQAFLRAIALRPDYVEAHTGLAALSLGRGVYADGWPDFISRYMQGGRAAPGAQAQFAQDLRGQTVFVDRDLGLGDELFYLRFASLLKARGARVVYRAGDKIASLLDRVDCIDEVIGADADLPDSQASLLVTDLPMRLGLRDNRDIPPPLRLSALPERRETMRQRLATLGPPPYIGLTWRAGSRPSGRVDGNLYKEAPLRELIAAIQGLGATFLVLQRQPQPAELDALAAMLGPCVHDLSGLNEDLENMLALLDLLDDYIAVSNTNVHLATALAKPGRALIPNPPKWRWMAEGDTSPWLPGFRVYRQASDGSWSAALRDLRFEMAQRWGVA